MKKLIKTTGLLIGIAIIAGLGLIGYVRLAPTDAARWHVDPAAVGFEVPANGSVFCVRPDNAFGPISGSVEDLLSALDGIVMATPRTRRVAGSAAEGRITWVTRSALMGYPDYITAQVMPGPGLCILGRQRFGEADLGVNAARIGVWAQEALGLGEPPKMTGF